MNFKKKAEKFLKKAEGFTLVELIVVIAILSVLAGVGTVGYSGYIKKANIAADNQLVAAVNRAYAAACLENGTDVVSLNSSVTMPLTGAEGHKKVDVAGVRPFGEDFAKYFTANAESEFRVYKRLKFENGVFVGYESAGVEGANGYVLDINDETKTLFNGSAFSEIEMGVLMGNVTSAANVAWKTLTSSDPAIQEKFFNSPEYLDFAGSLLNDDGSAFADMNEMLAVAVGKYGSQEKALEVTQSALVLYAAQNAANTSKQDVVDLLTGAGGKSAQEKLLEGLANDPANTVPQAAVAYGMYVSYLQQTGGNVEGLDPTTVLTSGLNDSNFQQYVQDNKDSNISADYDGFMAAMNMINGTAQNKDSLDQLLENGFTDAGLIEDLVAALAK